MNKEKALAVCAHQYSISQVVYRKP